MKNPTYQNAVDSGLGVPEVWDGEDWTPALEAKISEISVGASVFILGWRNKLVVDLSRLTREFAADPEAVIDGEPQADRQGAGPGRLPDPRDGAAGFLIVDSLEVDRKRKDQIASRVTGRCLPGDRRCRSLIAMLCELRVFAGDF